MYVYGSNIFSFLMLVLMQFELDMLFYFQIYGMF